MKKSKKSKGPHLRVYKELWRSIPLWTFLHHYSPYDVFSLTGALNLQHRWRWNFVDTLTGWWGIVHIFRILFGNDIFKGDRPKVCLKSDFKRRRQIQVEFANQSLAIWMYIPFVTTVEWLSKISEYANEKQLWMRWPDDRWQHLF